ncbi:MAG: 16S rRNA (adenine(1518)-N(6)/adenine(1519)-N(6))-dimethyltransferase RsmA [Actinomycetota bacterium]
MAEPVRLLTPSDIGELARRHGIRPTKALGQNFIIDPNTIRRIVRLAQLEPSDRVIEVGAGVGTLTLALSQAVRQVTAIELDRRLIPALFEVMAGHLNVKVVQGDAMQVDYRSLTGGAEHRMLSNLPYNIATPLIADLLEQVPAITDFVVTVQREAGERFVAPPGSRTYGAVSVLVAYHCTARVLGKVPATVFWPVPKVESILVRLTRRPAPVEVSCEELMRVVRAAFAQRRKTVRNSLGAGLGMVASDVEEALRRAGIASDARAESLGLEQFAALTQAVR